MTDRIMENVAFERGTIPPVENPTHRWYQSATGLQCGASRNPALGGEGYGWGIAYYGSGVTGTIGYPHATLDEAWAAMQAKLRELVTEFQKGVDP